MPSKPKALAGIDVVHARACSRRSNGRCNCSPGYRAQVWDPRLRKLHRKTFRDRRVAEGWRDDVRHAVRKGTMSANTKTTVTEAGRALVAGMEAGTIRNSHGAIYKPSTIRSYKTALEKYVIPDLGAKALSDVRRRDAQDLVDRLIAKGFDGSTIRNKIDPLRVIYRRALDREEVSVDPTVKLRLPRAAGKRDRIVTPSEGAALVAALPEGERALWATMLYAGLRRGEARALAWDCVDFDAGVVRVEWGWDDVEGRIDVKTGAGRRRVPIVGSLRKALAAHKLATGRSYTDLCFGITATVPFEPSTTRDRARAAWMAAGLDPLAPHEARHCCASFLIAAGVDLKRLSTYMGHSSFRITFDRYGHLIPGGEADAAAKLDAFLESSAASTGA